MIRRVVVAAAALATAVLLQLTIVNGLPLPGGGVPDLVLICVVALGLTGGTEVGLTGGFLAGLALDLAPPASELIGQYALVLCLAGYLGGKLRFTVRQSAALALSAALLIAAAGEAMAAALTLALDTPEVTWTVVAQVLPSSVLYDVAASPLVLFAWVRIAVALGVSFSLIDDSPALESGGSAAPAALAAAGPGRRARIGTAGGDSRAAASGRWLVGDTTADAPAVGAVGWLAGPVTSRRARREQARLTALLTGASPRKGAFWVGGRPAGLVPVTSPAPFGSRGPSRLRPQSGVAGSAASQAGPAGLSGHALAAPPVRLGLADEQRRRAKAADRARRRSSRTATGRPEAGLCQHGLDRHGLDGPGVPRIAFRTWGLAGSGPAGSRRAAGGGVPRIAFGSPGGLAGSGRAAGGGVPRIAFGTGGLAGSGRAAGGGVPRIAFGTGGLAGSGRAAGGGVPRIAFGTGGLAGSGRAAGGGVPRIAFGTGGLAGSGRAAGGGVPRIAFGASGVTARRRTSPHRPAVAKFRSASSRSASGQWLAHLARTGSTLAGSWAGLPGAGRGAAGLTRAGRRPRQPSFTRSAPRHGAHHRRQRKTARMRAGRWPLRRLSWLRPAGGRSAVWRIGSTRIGGYR